MIILLGLPKTGTTSFHTLFRQLGFHSYHWKHYNKYVGELIHWNCIKKKPLLRFVPINHHKYAVTQMDVCISEQYNYWPQITHYEQIWNENPNALYIVNIRDPYKTLASWKKWNNLDARILKYNPELFQSLNNISDDEKIISLIETHYQRVKSFLQEKGAKWIEYDIEHDSIDKLREILHIPPHITMMPHENKSSNN